MSAADRVTKHRALVDAGLVELGRMTLSEIGLQELLIAWKVLPPTLIENYTPAELTAGAEKLLALQIATFEALLEKAAPGALHHASQNHAPIVDDADSHDGEDDQ